MEFKMSSPYDDKFDQPRKGLIRQELITYEERDGSVYKTVTTRVFFDNDYTDSQTSIPLMTKT